jgi:putative FmdB family regulatory protein
MPTYEYECRACGLRFERQQGITDAPLTQCPKCGGEVRRLISGGSGFIMKGGQGRLTRDGGGCSLETEGHTCCGRTERCGEPSCGKDGE